MTDGADERADDDLPGASEVRDRLANERTLLAWLRTALGLLAAGVAVLELATSVDARVPIGVAVLGAGVVAAVVGLTRYRTTERAIRAGVVPRPGRGPEVVTAVVVALCVLVASAYVASDLL